jgi:hypothetical protein
MSTSSPVIVDRRLERMAMVVAETYQNPWKIPVRSAKERTPVIAAMPVTPRCADLGNTSFALRPKATDRGKTLRPYDVSTREIPG